ARGEADGLRSHGLLRLPADCSHLACGKVDGRATPWLERSAPGVLLVDAAHGFAHPAIELGLGELAPAARAQGVAALAVRRSYNCGVVGHIVERLAEQGFVALAFVNAPASIAPWGGRTPLFGTNPVAFAAPRRDGAPLVIDQSSSVVARGEVMLRAQRGEPLPEGWAFDADGRPTTDPAAALRGSLAPAGGHKGSGLALMVEILAAVLVGATPSAAASSFADDAGGPPGTGQMLVAFDPDRFVGRPAFLDALEGVCAAMTAQEGVRLPGDRRLAARRRTAATGVAVDAALRQRIEALAR
ncbi:Ldh family oxidoreductase, partial [Elioraea sp.]|uniref:Ldh family oxidoreductase n=1 Tax=Elioraea sp. TaxID=2185103 RepID=UPI00307D1525